MWDKLKEKIESLPAFRSLEGRLGEDGGAASATGLVGSSRSLVLSILAGKFAEPALVLAADPVSARDIAADLEEFGLAGVVSYPEDEILPYDYHDPDRNLTGQQMLALERMAEGECRVLVSTPRAILKKVFPPSLFRTLLFDLAVGERGDPQAAAGKLVRLGYERHGTVESKGQFAIRGAILDIFEVASEDPVRVEFDSDEIATIRRFDIETQRSIGNMGRIRVRPLHHLAPDAAGMKRLRAFLADGAGEGEELKRRMLAADRMEEGILFYGMEHYAPVVHDVVPVFEYFNSPPVVATFDTEDVDTVTEEFREEMVRRHEQSLEKEHRYPEPDAVYVTGPEMERFLEGRKRIDFRRLPVGNAVAFSTSSPGDYRRNLKGLAADIEKDVAGKRQVLIFCSSDAQRERAEEILSDVALDVDFPVGIHFERIQVARRRGGLPQRGGDLREVPQELAVPAREEPFTHLRPFAFPARRFRRSRQPRDRAIHGDARPRYRRGQDRVPRHKVRGGEQALHPGHAAQDGREIRRGRRGRAAACRPREQGVEQGQGGRQEKREPDSPRIAGDIRGAAARQRVRLRARQAVAERDGGLLPLGGDAPPAQGVGGGEG